MLRTSRRPLAKGGVIRPGEALGFGLALGAIAQCGEHGSRLRRGIGPGDGAAPTYSSHQPADRALKDLLARNQIDTEMFHGARTHLELRIPAFCIHVDVGRTGPAKCLPVRPRPDASVWPPRSD